MEEQKKFSIRARGKSIYYSFEGLFALFRGEHNMWIHLLATIVVIALAVLLRVNSVEFAILFLAMGMVWSSEIFNSAIEKIMDFITEEKKPQIKFIKDIAAAAVLVSALAALVTGCFIFIPKILLHA